MIRKLALCDDNHNDLTTIISLLNRYAEERHMTFRICTYATGQELISAHEDEGDWFDLILLDVLMQPINGIDTARRLRRRGLHTPILFLTGSRDFAVES